MNLADIPDEEKRYLLELVERKLQEFEQTRLYRYAPYPKQAKFHAAGGSPTIRERLLIAANQVGKTLASCAEIAYHLTGDYPEGWGGAAWDYAPTGWAGSVTAQGTRDSLQRLLMGKPEAWGTGLIPGNRIVNIKRAAGNVPDCIESVTVKHASGGLSRLVFKNYAQGREAWQAETLDFVVYDEEPPMDLYTEGLTRTNATGGIVWMTFTPLLGMSQVVKRFLVEKPEGTYVVHMTLEDAAHYTPEERTRLIAAYPEHERAARTRGVPIMGSGLIYPVDEATIRVPAFAIPRHWPRIVGLDFGYDHPTAASWLAWDRDTDTVYVTDEYRERQLTPVLHAAAVKARGAWIPVAWPHDGVAHDKGGGEPLAKQFKDQGCNMLPEKATHPPLDGQVEGSGGYSVEAGILAIYDRMQTGRLRVFEHLAKTFEELRMYHRINGQICKEDDDIMDAMRAGHMMLRHAKVRPLPKHQNSAAAFRALDPAVGY